MSKLNFHITLLIILFITSLLIISCEEEATRPKPTKKPDAVGSNKDLLKDRKPTPEESALPGARTDGRDLTLNDGGPDTRVFISDDHGQHSGGGEGGSGGSMDSGGGGCICALNWTARARLSDYYGKGFIKWLTLLCC